ncbi:Lsr2-like DNA bridging protein [Gordonia phage Keelan]|nr:Lsr2-like DNA bridging protein [Gordonia phage Keelan]
MARRVISQIEFVDDFTKTVVPEDKLKTVTLSFGNQKRSLDLSTESFNLLEDVLTPWLAVGTPVSNKGKQPEKRNTFASAEEMRAARKWAKENGIPVSQKGKVANAVVAQYRQAKESK